MPNGCKHCQESPKSSDRSPVKGAQGALAPVDRKSPPFWIKALAAVFLANLAVMVFFTFTVNSKLTDAIELAKPQEGNLTLLTSDQCPLCRDFSSQKDAVMAQNVDILEEKELTGESSEGAEIIERYGIEKLPALVFESRERIKTSLKQTLEKNGRSVSDTVIVWEQGAPPYYDIAASQTAGLVDVTYLTDKRCDECTDVQQTMRSVLGRLGLVPASETVLDISDADGRALVNQYDITQVPTVILSPEVEAYDAIASTWKQIGTVEEDGSYVFRVLSALRMVYRDLESGEVVGGK